MYLRALLEAIFAIVDTKKSEIADENGGFRKWLPKRNFTHRFENATLLQTRFFLFVCFFFLVDT